MQTRGSSDIDRMPFEVADLVHQKAIALRSVTTRNELFVGPALHDAVVIGLLKPVYRIRVRINDAELEQG